MTGARKHDPRDPALDRELRAAFKACDWQRCAEVLGRLEPRDAEHPSWRDPAFVAWLAAELRARERRLRRTSDAAFLARGEALLARAQSRRLRVARRATAPPGADAPSAVTPARLAPLVTLGVAAGVGRELWDEPPERWVEVPTDLPGGDYVALRIAGDSMMPLMHSGDTVLVRRGAVVKAGSVIVARHPDDGYVCKEVQRVRRDAIELVSLAPGGPSLQLPHDAACVVGTVLLVWCEHERLAE